MLNTFVGPHLYVKIRSNVKVIGSRWRSWQQNAKDNNLSNICIFLHLTALLWFSDNSALVWDVEIVPDEKDLHLTAATPGHVYVAWYFIDSIEDLWFSHFCVDAVSLSVIKPMRNRFAWWCTAVEQDIMVTPIGLSHASDIPILLFTPFLHSASTVYAYTCV